MRPRGGVLLSLSSAAALLAALTLSGCGSSRAAHNATRAALAACVRAWNGSDKDRHREALAIVVHGALPNTGVAVTLKAPRGEAGELGTSPNVQTGPGRCVIGEQRNTLFVYAGAAWHMVTPTGSDDPALAVVNDSDDHPNASADGEGRLALK